MTMHITDFRVFCTRNPAMMPIVVGRDAAQTPSRFNVFSSIPEATTRGGAHYHKVVCTSQLLLLWDTMGYK